MTDQGSEVVKRRRLKRQDGGRTRGLEVRLTEEEWVELHRQAEAAKVTVARFLVESAVLGDRHRSPAHAPIATLLTAKRQVAGAATALNQLAKVCNSTGKVPDEVADVARRMEETVDRLEDVTERLA